MGWGGGGGGGGKKKYLQKLSVTRGKEKDTIYNNL
jgi:hypothetical protein